MASFDDKVPSAIRLTSPASCCADTGLAAMSRRKRRLCLEWIAVVVPYAVVTAAYHMWWGGYSSPARFIGATLLILAVLYRRDFRSQTLATLAQ